MTTRCFRFYRKSTFIRSAFTSTMGVRGSPSGDDRNNSGKLDGAMTVRRGRQRRERRQDAGPIPNSGGLGGDRAENCNVWPAKPSRSDLRLIRQAAKNDWPASAAARQRAEEAVCRVVGNNSLSDRHFIAAAEAMIEMAAANQRAERRSRE